MSTFHEIFAKYDIPAPRYTSYPTVPYWDSTPTSEQWISHLNQAFQNEKSSWSMYMHIPFCESLCTFCGCNNTITKDHKRSDPYVQLLVKEWENYLKLVPELGRRPLRQLHLGGGTPTFLDPNSLRTLLKPIMSSLKIDAEHFEGAVEVDPRRTSIDHLLALREFGFNRVSMGVQDFNPEVQRLVNRIQPFEITADLTAKARAIGFHSVNFDLIYGLAKQTPESIRKTAQLTVELRPDRIALYSFALVPWIKPQQRLFKDEDLPTGAEKRELYEIARGVLLDAGYVEVGMDHFALPTEALAVAQRENRLHRNFMGYTDVKTDVLLGLGVSSISESPWSFHQNEKVMTIYEQKIAEGKVPTHRGHILTESDQHHRAQILEFMTRYKVPFVSTEQAQDASQFLAEMKHDGLIQIENGQLVLTEKGRPFLRNACLFFDERLRAKSPQTKIFSSSI